MTRFVFMLTRNDVTVPDAREYVDRLAATDVRYVGFKDVGLPEPELRELSHQIRANGQVPVLEVVDVGGEQEIESARAAMRLDVELLVGGTRVDDLLGVLGGSAVRLFPYIGEVVGHPAKLEGSTRAIVNQARALDGREGVAGINLLAYRWTGGDGLDLARAVRDEVDLPLLCAGSVDSLERVRALRTAEVWGFTVGTAALDGRFVPGGFEDQIEAIVAAAGEGGQAAA